MSATDNGAPFDNISDPLTDDEGENLFLQHFLGQSDADDQPSDEDEGNKREQPAPKKKTEDDDQPEADNKDKSADDEDQPDEAEDKGEGDEEGDEDEKPAKFADDDVFVKVKQGDEEHQVPIRDLKRLWGQEAALTRKSMEVSTQRKAVEDELAKASVATTALLQRARAAYEPFSKVDFLLASQQLSPEDYTALRNQAMQAAENVQFLEGHLNELMDGIKQRQQSTIQNAAKESLKVLTGPVEQGGIEGFNTKLYDDIRAFAVREGAPPDVINQIVEPWALRMMHDAMLYRRGKSKVITKKVNKTPKKIIKTTTAAVDTSKGGMKSAKAKQAMERLQRTGSADDAAAAFLAGWEATSDDN